MIYSLRPRTNQPTNPQPLKNDTNFEDLTDQDKDTSIEIRNFMDLELEVPSACDSIVKDERFIRGIKVAIHNYQTILKPVTITIL